MLKVYKHELGLVIYVNHLSTWEAKAEGWRVQGQPELHRKTLTQVTDKRFRAEMGTREAPDVSGSSTHCKSWSLMPLTPIN